MNQVERDDCLGRVFLEILDETTLCSKASGLKAEQVHELAKLAKEQGRPLVELVVERGGAVEVEVISALAKLMTLPCLPDEKSDIPEEVLASISPSTAIANHIMPIEVKGRILRIACFDPFDWQRWDELSHILERPIERVLTTRIVIERMLKRYYGIGADTVERLVSGDNGKTDEVVERVGTDLSEEEAANEPTVVSLVNKILTEAIRANATDIHFEPYESKYRIRYRIDGMLEDVSIPVSVRMLKLALVSRIKIMSNLDITEKRLPQDGRCTVALAGQDYDLRVSILPGVHGEAVVIRLQSRQMVKLDLDALGFESEENQKISSLVSRPYGLILVTGPTGSGKTTTLYACLNRIISPTTKIVTVEDPVEYWVEDILQMQVHEEIGFTFARALRGILRHDPDIVLVGEIRDRETADIAVRAALTGHLVFATLHTNDSASAATRLIDIGIEPFLVASAVQGILAQRLVRKICPNCRQKQSLVSPNNIERKLMADADSSDGLEVQKGNGCEKCRFTGYRGRTAVVEVLTVTARIRDLIQKRQSAERVKTTACKAGLRTLRESAILAMKAGKTTISEVLRVTQGD